MLVIECSGNTLGRRFKRSTIMPRDAVISVEFFIFFIVCWNVETHERLHHCT